MTASDQFFDSPRHFHRRLRILMAVSLIGMPLLVAALSGLFYDIKLQMSLSAYYHAHRNGDVPRALFVIFLAFLGGILLAYRGFGKVDNWVHNLAGVAAFLVILFPMECCRAEHYYCEINRYPSLSSMGVTLPPLLKKIDNPHAFSAAMLFVASIISVVYAGGYRMKTAIQSLQYKNPAGAWANRYLRLRTLPMLAIVLAVITFFAMPNSRPCDEMAPQTSGHCMSSGQNGFQYIFFAEYFGFLGFGLYWYRFSRLIDDANDAGKRIFNPACPPALAPTPVEASGAAQSPVTQAPSAALASSTWVDLP